MLGRCNRRRNDVLHLIIIIIIIYKENARERGATTYLGRPILAGRALATVAGVGKRECEVDGGGMEGVGSILHPTPRRRFSSERSISL